MQALGARPRTALVFVCDTNHPSRPVSIPWVVSQKGASLRTRLFVPSTSLPRARQGARLWRSVLMASPADLVPLVFFGLQGAVSFISSAFADAAPQIGQSGATLFLLLLVLFFLVAPVCVLDSAVGEGDGLLAPASSAAPASCASAALSGLEPGSLSRSAASLRRRRRP